jgi:hypothetical protein
MLAAQFAVTAVRHVQLDVFVAPDPTGTFALWAMIVLPPTLVLCGVSFLLGTLYPRRATLITLSILVAWFITANVLGRTAPVCQSCAYARDGFETACSDHERSDRAPASAPAAPRQTGMARRARSRR